MKAKIFTKISFVVLFAVIGSVLASCGMVSENIPDGYGKITLKLGNDSKYGRNVTQDDKDAAEFAVYFNGVPVEPENGIYEKMMASGIKLEIEAQAIFQGRMIGRDVKTITVREGENHVSMALKVYDNFVVTIAGKSLGYTKIEDAFVSASGKTATVKMNQNVSLTAPIEISGGNITLDLNGYTLTGAGPASTDQNCNSVIKITVGTFNLTGNGTINGKQNGEPEQDGCISVSSGSTFNMYSGTITGGYGEGGGVKNGGTFNMYGGVITGNREDTTNGGAGVSNWGTFNMSGGSITNNIGEGSSGGGVYSEDGTFTMTGGTISGNSNDSGGGVYLSGTFDWRGGTISGNTASDSGNNIFIESGSTYIKNGVPQDTSDDIIID